MSTWSPLTSWYSSIRTWSKRPSSSRPMTSSATSARQQVVQVDQTQRLLARRVGLEQCADRFPVLLAPRKAARQDLAERLHRVDRARVDVEQRALLREALAALGVSMLLAEEIEHVGGVARVEYPEPGGQPDCSGVLAHEVMGDRVKRAAQDAAGAARHRHERPGALQHLARGAAREGEQQNALRRDPLADEPGNPPAQCRGLTGARTGQDQQRTSRMANRRALLRIQLLKPGRRFRRRRGGSEGRWRACLEHAFGLYGPSRTEPVCVASG